MSDGEGLHRALAAASNPRRATAEDAENLSHLFASAFMSDPVMNWIAREDSGRLSGLQHFFYWLLRTRGIPFGEVWMSPDASAAAVWLPPDAPASPGGVIEQLRLLPLFIRLCGWKRLARGSSMADAMEKHHPHPPHFYLAFIAVAPPQQGMGLGSVLMETTIKAIDKTGQPAYLENSNPKNARLYERCGFVARESISPKGAPPLIPMWRNAKAQGSSSLSQ